MASARSIRLSENRPATPVLGAVEVDKARAGLAALGLPVAAPAELDGLLQGFLANDRPGGLIEVSAAEHSGLAWAIDRLLIDS
jgi:hypothetical protein